MALCPVRAFGCILGLLQRIFEAFAVRDVLDHRLKFELLAFVENQTANGVLLPDDASIRSDGTIIERDGRLFGRHRTEEVERDRGVFIQQLMQQVGSEQFFAGFLIEAAEGAVHKGQLAVRGEAADQIGLVFDDGAETFLAFGNRFLRAPQLRG